MNDFSVLKKLAQDANEQFPALEEQWSMVCTPTVGLELLAEIERLRTAEGDAMTYKAGMENVAQQRDQLKAECEESAAVIDRLAKILAGVAVALKGEELPLHRHGYQDLVELVGVLKLENDLRAAENEALRQFILGFSEYDAEMAYAFAAMSKAAQ